MDEKHLVVDMMGWLGLPAVVVARSGLGTINHTLMTVRILREAGVRVAGVVVNRFPAETPGVAEETSPREIEKFGKVKVLCVVPEVKEVGGVRLSGDVVGAMDLVDWGGVGE
jgi:dethiobiotin synthetase